MAQFYACVLITVYLVKKEEKQACIVFCFVFKGKVEVMLKRNSLIEYYYRKDK